MCTTQQAIQKQPGLHSSGAYMAQQYCTKCCRQGPWCAQGPSGNKKIRPPQPSPPLVWPASRMDLPYIGCSREMSGNHKKGPGCDMEVAWKWHGWRLHGKAMDGAWTLHAHSLEETWRLHLCFHMCTHDGSHEGSHEGIHKGHDASLLGCVHNTASNPETSRPPT